MCPVTYHHIDVDGFEIAYREAGPPVAPALLLLHGFPTSSHMFRDLIPTLCGNFRVVAPDLPGFGRSAMPSHTDFEYTFENVARIISRFTELVGLPRFSIYVFDYGSPVGLRIALMHPERIDAIVSQNGNAYSEGLSDGWDPIRAYWNEPTQENRDALRAFLSPEATYWQYTHGVPDISRISPDGYSLDNFYLARPGAHDVQLDLLLDYASNVALYPKFQEYLRQHKPRLLAIWGRHDPFFLPAGAEAFRRDVPEAEVQFVESGHFALESHHAEISHAIRSFL